MTGRVYLVGAGCGDAGLITLRGLDLLRSCDAVVCDDLVDPALLDAAPDGAERICMGKRSGRRSAPQEEISARLIDLARQGRTVVRLKGGDPFVFGRGGEEILALQAAGIPYEEVPGVTSPVAIPALAGIPVTHRGLSRSVHIVTANTADSLDGLPDFLDGLAKLPGTLVFLMGLARLPEIASRLQAAGMDPDTPAAVVSGGNAPRPRAVRGTLRDIAEKSARAGMEPPATIVVGAVAAMNLSPTIEKPLAGVTVALTGTAAVTDKLRRGLEALGAGTFPAERSRVEEMPFDLDASRLCDGSRRWIVFTSANGVRIFFRRLIEEGGDLRGFHGCRFAVIGAATAEALAGYGIRADLCPEVYTVEALGRLLAEAVPPGEEILLYRSRRGNPALAETLSATHALRDIPVYDLTADPRTAERARARLEDADYIVFASGSGVELYFRQQGALPARAVPVCIGGVTARALEARADRPYLLAKAVSAQGIVDAIAERAVP